jgi:hypothetical protein
MSLLHELQNAAVDATVPISTLLRKCAVLAARLDNEELRAWVAKELNGYESLEEIPAYRVTAASATGHLAGPWNSGYQNITIPPSVLPKWGRRFGEEVRFAQPIATLEDLGKGEGVVSCRWPGDLLAYMQTPKGNKFADGMVLYAAWQTVAKATVIGIVDTVRNRVLEFALRLEKEAPAAGEPGEPGSAVPTATVTHLYQTIINAPVMGNVATGKSVVQTAGSINVAAGDLQALRRALNDFGIPDKDVKDLESAIEHDPPAPTLEGKPKTTAWLATIAGRVFSGALKLSKDITVDLLAQVVGQYLGIPQLPSL